MAASRPDTATTVDAEKAALQHSERPSAERAPSTTDTAAKDTPTEQSAKSSGPFWRRKKANVAASKATDNDSEKTAEDDPAPVVPPVEERREVSMLQLFRCVGAHNSFLLFSPGGVTEAMLRAWCGG